MADLDGVASAGCGGSCACGAGGVDRRTFVAKGTLAVVAALLAEACGTGVWEAVAPTSLNLGTGVGVKVSNFPALNAVGGIARVDGGTGAPLAVVRTGTATYTAFSLSCPHQGTTVNVTATGFSCPNHGALFNSAGTWTGGQVTGNLVSYTTQYNATTGLLTIAGTPVTTPTTTPTTPSSLVVTLSAFPALATVGGIARVDNGTGTPVALVRTSTTAFTALSMTCPHQGTTVQITSGSFTCPNHGARFASTGAWTGGQSATALPSFATVYDSAKGTVTVSVTGTTTGGGGRGDG